MASTASRFTDFNIEPPSLPAPSSPNPSYSTTPRPSSSHSSIPRSSKSASFLCLPYPVSVEEPARKMSPSPTISSSIASTVLQGSLPLMRFVGRGTPVDKTRRVEWGTLGGEEVTEDGLLLYPIRSASLDGAHRPSQHSTDWSCLGPSSTMHVHGRSRSQLFDQPPPKLAPLPINEDSAEDWSSLMQRMLESRAGSEESGAPDNDRDRDDTKSRTEDEEEELDTRPETEGKQGAEMETNTATGSQSGWPKSFGERLMTPEEIQQLDVELENDLGLNEALNLSLNPGGNMNVFKLDLVPPLPPSGELGCDTPSNYTGTPHASRPPSVQIHAFEDMSNASGRTEVAADSSQMNVSKKMGRVSAWEAGGVA
ncbi:hypothetical protein AX17_007470 [Amanita inopinata Kibby_2008]|nr:hypothetical protein AX17_007470 [Amanita inopinata Kibby_2008]